MSHVKVSFDTPEYTANADGIGTLRILEAIRILEPGRIKPDFTRLPQVNYMDWYRKSRNRKNSFLSQKSLCCGKIICLLDYRELP